MIRMDLGFKVDVKITAPFGDVSGWVFREVDLPWGARRWDGRRGDSSTRCLAECDFPS